MPFETGDLEMKTDGSRLEMAESVNTETLETIDAKLAALGDPDDPWAEPEAVAEREALVAQREGLVKAAEDRQRAAASQAAIETVAAEQAVADSAQADELAKRITSGELSKTQEIPSDDEILAQFGTTIVYDGRGRVSTYHENVRFSEQAMLAVLGKNIENVTVVPKEMLKKPLFKSLLKERYQERYPSGNFERFYRLVSDARYGFGESEPKWKVMSPEEIQRARMLAASESERLQELNYIGDDGGNFNRILGEGIHDMEAGREVV